MLKKKLENNSKFTFPDMTGRIERSQYKCRKPWSLCKQIYRYNDNNIKLDITALIAAINSVYS